MVYVLMAVILCASWVLPWWFVAPAGALVGRYCRSVRHAALAGFFGVFSAWAMALYYVQLKSHGRVGEAMAGLLGLSDPLLMIFVNAAFGGLLGMLFSVIGFATLSQQFSSVKAK